MDTDDLLCLRDVIASGSLTAVARKRGVAVSTIARRLDAIEATLKLTLAGSAPAPSVVNFKTPCAD
ncbi:MAG: hypothetical protein A4S16_09045 [Proteobacteria bacterium SG_bin6]|nr:MAG: hypothetical protein A4S16_09045 [Proteobacteria bacterium SG_bin6]